MRKALLIASAVLLAMGFVATANADSVLIQVKPLAITGGASAEVPGFEKGVGFTPTGNTFSINVAGKTCTFGSSTQGSAPNGCNYSVVITGDSVEPAVRQPTDAVCTATVKPECK